MSLYCVSIGTREYRINLSGGQILVDGKPVQLNLTPLNDAGLHLLRVNRQALELYLASLDLDTYEVLVNGRRLLARVETLQKRLRRHDTAANAGSMTAPMPGLVIQVQVKVGDEVVCGQTLVVLESMKMQMQLRAAVDGRVASISVQPGQQVEKGTNLVQIESNS